MLDFAKKLLRRKADPIKLLDRLAPADFPRQSIVHVGAHLAQEAAHYEAYGFREFLWVEGSPAIHARLEQVLANHAGPGKHDSRCALLTNCQGEQRTLHGFDNDGKSNSIFQSTQVMHERWTNVRPTGQGETVETTTLDQLLADTPFASGCDLLVVDVQGAELLVLQGGLQTLSKAGAIICEISSQPFYDGGVLYPELAAFLEQHGFAPTAMPCKHGDMLFMRKPSVARAA